MSGGFFRGTSAEQDTRFSNKQAKLMKSQKFAPELENLVSFLFVYSSILTICEFVA
jgi:serine/arginine repetitive matrix protein 1